MELYSICRECASALGRTSTSRKAAQGRICVSMKKRSRVTLHGARFFAGYGLELGRRANFLVGFKAEAEVSSGGSTFRYSTGRHSAPTIRSRTGSQTNSMRGQRVQEFLILVDLRGSSSLRLELHRYCKSPAAFSLTQVGESSRDDLSWISGEV